MSRLVLPENALNGGLPEPPASEPVRVVDAHHDACGAATRVRLPGTLSPRAVRRFHCAGCAAAFETAHIDEIELRMAAGMVAPPPVEPEPTREAQPLAMEERAVEALTREPARKPLPKVSKSGIAIPKLSLPKLSKPNVSVPKLSLPRFEPDGNTWRLLSIPIAAVLVVGGLLLLTGGDEQELPATPAPRTIDAAAPATPAGGGGNEADQGGAPIGHGSKNTKFVRESSFSLALPEGWEKVDPPAGATFAAVAADGGADATLWITQDPKLDFPAFINQSLAQLRTLAGSARVIERIPAPTPEGTIVTLGADAPEGQPTYQATLRVAGPYRYYLATTIQPDVSSETTEAVDLISGSLTPELEG